MSKLQPLHLGPGPLAVSRRPHTAPCPLTHPSTGSRQTWTHGDRAPSMTCHPGQHPLEQVGPLIHSRLADFKSAFMAVDPDGTGLVSREEFSRVLERLLSVSQNQLNHLLNEVCGASAETVDYMQFLGSFRRAPAAHRACSSRGSVRRGPQNTSMPLSDIQKHLKEKIGGNLRTVIRVFRLFDYNREGHIQQHEFRRILDNYCIQLTDKEFQRLWNHYSPSSASTISYQLFLEKLGFGDSYNFKIAPVCTKLEVSSRGTTPPEKVRQMTQRPESLSSPCGAPSVLPHRKLQSLFYNKMCMNSTPVWQALQAFDITRSGLVKQDVLRAVLSSFIFPMNPHSFQKLTSRYGVKAAGPVRWKHFLGHFMSPSKKEDDTDLHSDRILEEPAPDEDNLHLQDIYPRLREIFHMLDTREAGWITRADLQHLLERPAGIQPGIPQISLHPPQITELLNALDPEHTGVIQQAGLERLNPSITSAPIGNMAPPSSPAVTAELQDVHEKTKDAAEQQKAPDEKQTAQCADKVSVASASWSTMENLLLDKLCEQLSPTLAALKLCDPQHTGHVTREDLKKVLSSYGMPISDTHFNELCETSFSRPGSTSELVCYTSFLRNLGVPLIEEAFTSSCHEESYHTERPCASPRSTQQSVQGQRPPSSLQVGPDTCSILQIVFRRMRLRLEQRCSSLTDRIQAVTHSSDGTLSVADVRKILEDSWVMLDDDSFTRFTELLGFRDGRIDCSVFLKKYEEARGRDGQQSSEDHGNKDEVDPLPTTAEQCLTALKPRIKIVHGNNLTAFRLMDRKRKGVVDCHDFRVLYSSLGFFCREEEYQRLLDLIGLHPDGNLNYAEFVDVVENKGRCKQRTQTASVQEQLHDLLAREARYKWADMSKLLCQFDTDGRSWIHKKSLRGLLFTYALPLRSDEFDQLWLRYDPECRGYVAICDFLEKLGFHHEGKRNQTDAQQDGDRPASSDSGALENIQQTLQGSSEGLSDPLTHLEGKTDRAVTVEQLLSLLNTYSRSVQRETLVNQLHRLNVSIDENCRLAHTDFLSVFDDKEDNKHELPPASPDPVRLIESFDKLSPAAALARMRQLVTTSAPNLYKAFTAFDQSGTGMVKALDFRQVLDNFCARLSDKQFRYMLSELELDRENKTVNWKDFLNKFQSQSTQMSGDGCLSKTLEQETETRSPIQTKMFGTTNHLRQIQEVVPGQLHEITKELMDLDPSNSAAVSKEQFRQLCDRHCLRLTNDQFECVWSQMPVNENKKLQCGEFLKHFGALGRTATYTEAEAPTNTITSPSPGPGETIRVKESCRPETASGIRQQTKSAPQRTSRRPASVGSPGTGSLLGSTERRLRGAVQRCWKEIQRKCTKEDPQQGGRISTSSFLGILQSLGISLTLEQLEHLAVKFDYMKNGCVSYHNFLHHFLLNLPPAETKRPFERRTLPLPITTMSRGVLSKDCVEAMLRIYDVVCSSWTSIRRCFLTSDRRRTGIVSVQDFRKVLRHFSVNLSEEEFFHLSSYFDANTTGNICYNSFLWAFLH